MRHADAMRGNLHMTDRQISAGSVLFVDLDGTLILGDTLIESFLRALKINPIIGIQALFWILRGLAYLKERLATLSEINVRNLPYRAEVIAFLNQERLKGRIIVLATATNVAYATEIAEHLGIFEAVLASDGFYNLKGSTKRFAIEEYCREHKLVGYSYIGDSLADIPIWEGAQEIIVVAPDKSIYATISKLGQPVRVLGEPVGSSTHAIAQAMRPQHWIKNLLIFAPIVFGHQLGIASSLQSTCLAFIAFCAVSSAVYIFNDLFDIDSDRNHPIKKFRPIASGVLSAITAIWVAVVLVTCSVFIATVFLPPSFAFALIGYFSFSMAYTCLLKQQLAIDVIALASLYLVRIYAGGCATGIQISYWLSTFALFMCVSIALAKRYAELIGHIDQDTMIPGRGYKARDESILRSFGSASGIIAVLILALYIDSAQVRVSYENPSYLWFICPLLLYWIMRLWISANRRQADDPVIFMQRDGASVFVVLCMILIVIIA